MLLINPFGRPGVSVARLHGNPFQATLREIAARTPLRWGVNLVLAEGAAAEVRAGDPAAVQEALARTAAPAWLRTAGERSKICTLAAAAARAKPSV